MEIKIAEYNYKNSKENIKFENDQITGIMIEKNPKFLETILLKDKKANIFLEGKKLSKKELEVLKSEISYVTKEEIEESYINIKSMIYSYIIKNSLHIKDPEKKIIDALRIVGLKKDILKKTYLILSSSEKKLLIIAISLLSNPKIIILNDPYRTLDKKNKRIVSMLLRRLKDQFKITLIIISDDSEILYKYTDRVIIFGEENIIQMNSTDCFTNVSILNTNKLIIPESTKFTHLAKELKCAKIDFHKDVRDIIKDIYKHI